MALGPGSPGRAPAHLSVLPGGARGLDDLEEDRTTIEPAPTPDDAPTPIAAAGLDEQWEDGTTVAEQSQSTSTKRGPIVEEATIEDAARPLPPLQLVPPPAATDPAAMAKLVVMAGPDQGRAFELRAGTDVRIGRAVDNDIVLTDIAVSRKHMVLSWDGTAWVIHDNGSGNGTLVNDRIEDGRCQLHHGDRVEIGNTILRVDHPPSAHQPIAAGWGQQEEEAATVAGKAPVRATQVAAAAAAAPVPRHRPASVTAPVRERPVAPRRSTSATEPPPPPTPRPRAGTVPPPIPRATAIAPATPPPPVHAPPPASMRAPSAPVPLAPPPTSHPSMPVPVVPPPAVYPAPVAAAPMPSYPPQRGFATDPRSWSAANPYLATPPPRKSNRKLWIAIGAVALTATATAGALLGGGAPAAKAPPAAAKSIESDPSGGSDAAAKAPLAAAALTPDPDPAPAVDKPVDPTPAPAVDKPADPTPAPAVDKPADPTPAPAVDKPVVDKPADPPPTSRTTPPRTAPTRPDRTAAKVRPSSPGKSLDIDTPTKPTPAPKGLTAASKKADGLYRAKDWKGAAAILRDAAGASTEPEAKAMRARANDYEAIGSNLNAGLAMTGGRVTEALGAYKKARSADQRSGGAHQSLILSKIAEVAPKAAATYMTKSNYELAKLAADDAVNVGAGGNPTIAGVRSSLERKAGELYQSAVKVQKSKPREAVELATRITKMVPASSPWYAKAMQLKRAGATRSADEDE